MGGVETLFGDDVAQYIERKASGAFATAGISANKYMETVTSFSASLIQSLDGDTTEAAKVADQAIIDMADNANKMGTSIESIQNAYNGFAKGNFTMLDNLKLGYGGTKSEMERLIEDASKMTEVQEELGIAVDAGDMSFANIARAITVVQKNLGIYGATAEEAEGTISGSLAMMKAAWQNTVSALGGDSEEALSEYINDLVYSAQTVATNMMPVIKQAVGGLATLISELAPVIASELPQLLTDALPGLLQAGLSVVQTLAEGILNALPTLLPNLVNFIIGLGNMIISNLPLLLRTGLMIVIELAKGITAAIPDLIPTITEVIVEIAMMLTDPDMLISLVEAGLELILALAEGLIQALPQLIERLPEIIQRLVSALIDLAPQLLLAAGKLILTLAEGLIKSAVAVVDAVKEIWNRLKETWMEKIGDVKKWGRDLIDNFIGGIKEKWESFKQTISDLANTVKDFLGFSEPKEGPLSNFHTFAPDMMDLFMSGVEAKTPELESVVSQSFNLEPVMAESMAAGANEQNEPNFIIRLEGDAAKFFTYTIEQNRIYKRTHGGDSAYA